jgi:hypothetical protein
MDTLTFISSILSSIAWPLTIVLLAYLFRNSIARILDSVRLKRIKRGDLQIEFEQKLTELKEKVDVAVPSKLHYAKPNKKLVAPGDERFLIDNEIQAITNVNPAAGIALAWSHVERELSAAVSRLGISADYARNPANKNIQLLKESGYINQEIYGVLNDLRTLRNKAVHAMYDPTLTIAEAEDFSQVSENIVRILSLLKRK